MSQIKILLVDDRIDNLISIEAILDGCGYAFSKATSGRQALKILLKEHDFTLILMDVKMPDLGGFETAALIYEREKLKHIPIIFITAHSYSDEKVYEGYKTGAVDYIYKPINPQLLRAKVSVFVDLYQKNHQLLQQEQKLKAANENLEREVIERKISEERIRELNTQLKTNIETLENANSELAQFAYVASHDLQEPLRKIRAFGDLLKGKYYSAIEKDGQNYIERMQNASERMQSLINDILEYSKLSSILPFNPINIKPVIEDILNDLEITINETGAKISIEGEFPIIDANSGQIRQLFQNIISNALKFRKDSHLPKIKIFAETIKGKEIKNIDKTRKSEDFCRLTISDNGIGFDEQYAEQIFTLFKRLNDNSIFKGTGIGLAICKKIIEQHKGFIHAESAINEGSIFTIILPLIQHENEADTNQQVLEGSYS